MTDNQLIALVARATDIIIRTLAPMSVCVPREVSILRQLAAAVEAAAPPSCQPVMSDADRDAHTASALRQLTMLGHIDA